MFVNVYNLKVLECPSAFRAKSIYHVCIEMRQSLVGLRILAYCQYNTYCDTGVAIYNTVHYNASAKISSLSYKKCIFYL